MRIGTLAKLLTVSLIWVWNDDSVASDIGSIHMVKTLTGRIKRPVNVFHAQITLKLIFLVSTRVGGGFRSIPCQS